MLRLCCKNEKQIVSSPIDARACVLYGEGGSILTPGSATLDGKIARASHTPASSAMQWERVFPMFQASEKDRDVD